MEWEMKASNLLQQTYTPTPGSSCLCIKSLAHAASLLVLWMPPAARALSSRAHWWMKPSQCVERSSTSPKVSRPVTDDWPSLLSIKQPGFLFSITWVGKQTGEKSGLSHKPLTRLQITAVWQKSSQPESCSYLWTESILLF